MLRYRSATASISLLALALAGCNKSAQDMSAATASPSPDSGLPALPAALPMQTGPATPLAVAPPVAALPVRHYVNYARPARDRDAYAYLDRASDVQDEIGDAPPDYDYHNDDGATPWVWQTSGGDYRYAERGPDGYRYYYYQPGAREPYLVRTHDRSYAYAAGALVAVFALTGALLSHDHYDEYRDEASRYYGRGENLRQADNERPHEGVVAADWSQQRQQFSRDRNYWASARQQQPDWQAYHAQNDPSQQRGWQQEYQQRQQAAQQFSGWQSRGLQGPPPPALAGAGPRAADGQRPPAFPPGARPPAPFAGQQPGMDRPAQGGNGPQGFVGPDQPHRRDMGGPPGNPPVPNAAGQAAAREQQFAAQREAQRQTMASQRLAREAEISQRQAVARQDAAVRQQQELARQQSARQQIAREQMATEQAVREQAAKQQTIANVHRQQEMAAQQEVAGRQLAQQRQAQLSVHQAEMHALAAQRQAEMAQVQESRVRRAAPPAARERPPEPAPRPEARPPAPHAPEARPPAAQDAPHPDRGHGQPGHENDHHNQ